LRRGFVLVRDDAHRPVTSRAAACQQTRFTLEFHDGRLPVKREMSDE
jgi:exonuclease VII large subunit